jgi:hypothetical protein
MIDFLGLRSIVGFFSNPNVILVLKILYYSMPFWLLFVLVTLFYNLWMTTRRAQYFASLNYSLLEIKLPKEIFKSPLAMEFLFNALYQTGGESKWKIKWWPFKIESEYYFKGQTRPWYSFEICAIDGRLRFFIWTRANFKNLIEAQLYSQYPGIEIYEVSDYTLPFSYDPEKNSVWATEFELTKADPYPIKTYIDYGMDKDPKEEFKIDPMTPLVEFLASLGENHNVWIQIVATAHIAENTDPATGKAVDLKWAKAAKDEVKKILDTAKPPKDDSVEVKSMPRPLTKGETDTITALERSITKPGFDVGIRAVYFAPKELFNKANSAGIIAGFTHYNSNLNGFKPRKGSSPEKDNDKSHILLAYKNRGYFYNEFKRKSFVLNTEELATIYHLPGQVSSTPAFERIGSRKAPAPGNLPI